MNSCCRFDIAVRAGRRAAWAAVTLLLAAGCQLHEGVAGDAPAVSTRFTSNPLSGKTDNPEFAVRASHVPATKLGLALQSNTDPVHVQFASRLGTVLVRELQLSGGSLAVQPMATLQSEAAIPSLAPGKSASDVITVAFTDAQDTLPSQLPPNPLLMAAAPPVVDQILVVRVIEYRPYFPLLTTLEIRVLNGDSLDPIFATTATWSGVDYRLTDSQPKRTLREKLFSTQRGCEPSPGHNSPQALMHEISKDIANWYNHSLQSADPGRSVKKASLRDRWKAPFRSNDCKPCEASVTGITSTGLTSP
jgi:hypothetical protein